jgi:hypothetical protein
MGVGECKPAADAKTLTLGQKRVNHGAKNSSAVNNCVLNLRAGATYYRR